jgi:hypothetical protein
MALSEQEFAELQALLGGGSETQKSPVVGGGRGVAQMGTTTPNQQIAAQRQYEQEQQLAAKKKALEEQGFAGYTLNKGVDILTGRGEDGNLVSRALTGPTGAFNRLAALAGSTQAQKEMAQSDLSARREKQLQEDLYGPQTFVEKVGTGLANVGRYATQEPKLFASEAAQQLFDPTNVALGAVGAPVRGAGMLTNVGRAVGGGALGAGVPSAVRSAATGGLDLEQAAVEGATGGIVSGGLYGVGRTVSETAATAAKPFSAVKEALSPLKQAIPKPIAELITTNNNVAQTFDDLTAMKQFYGADFKPNLAELTKEVAVIDRAQMAAKNDVNAILSLRSNRTATEEAFNAKLNSSFPSSDAVLNTFGKDVAKQNRVLESSIAAQEDALKNITAKFKATGGSSTQELGTATRELRDKIKATKAKYWGDVFNEFKTKGDAENISMSPKNVEQLYTSTKNIPKSVFDGFDPVTQKAIAELNKYIEVQEQPGFSMVDASGNPLQVSPASTQINYNKVPFSVLHDYSTALNREYSKLYNAASVGNPDARVMINQVRPAKDALDTGLSTLPGNFGTSYIETKAKYGREFMNPFYEGFGGQLGKRNKFGESIQDSDVAAKLVSKPEYIQDFLRLNDNSPEAQQAVKEALIQKFLKADSVINADGSIKSEKLQSFLYSNTDSFKAAPEAQKAFQNLQTNLDLYLKSKADMEVRKAAIADAATAQLLKKTRLEDVFNTNESGAFAKPEMLNKLLTAAEKDKTGAEKAGIQRAMIEAAQKSPNPSDFIAKNKGAFDKAFTGQHAQNLKMIEKGLAVLETKLNVRPGEKITNYRGVAFDAGVAGGLGFISPFLSAGYIALSAAVRYLKNRKERLENSAYVNALSNPEVAKELLININKAQAALNSGKQVSIDNAVGALKQTMINNGIAAGSQQQGPATQVAPMPEIETQPAPAQQPASQGLSDAEFEELRKEINNSKPQKQQVSSIIEDEAARLGIPQHADLLTKLAKQESGFKQSAVSPKGAIGVMQLMPTTAQELGVDPTDLEQNVRGGVRYWAKQLRFFNGDTKLATAAYNAGAGNVIKAGNQVPNFKETQNYVAAIVG